MLTAFGSERISILFISLNRRADVKGPFNEVRWTAFHLQKYLTDILTKDAQIQENHSVKEEQDDYERRKTWSAEASERPIVNEEENNGAPKW